MVRAAPLAHRLQPLLLHGLVLGQALQGAIVALVELPPWSHVHPGLAAGLQGELGGDGGALEHGAEDHVELEAVTREDAPRVGGLFTAVLREGDVTPPREDVVLVEERLAMAHHDHGVRRR